MSVLQDAEQSDPIQVVRSEMNRLRGRLFGAIEAVGFPERQETAVKSLVRTITYEAQANLESSIRKGDD